MTSRRGSLEWSLETAGKLVLYALVLVAIIYMSFKLVSLFASAEQEWVARRNLDLLTERISDAQRDDQVSLIVNLPRDYVLIGFDDSLPVGKDITFQKSLAPSGTDKTVDLFNIALFGGTYLKPNVYVKRPDCGAVCICVYRISSGLNWSIGSADTVVVSENREIRCDKIKDATTITGSWEYVQWRQKDAGADYTHTVKVPDHVGGGKILAIGGNVGPVDVLIAKNGETITLSTAPTTP